MVTVDTRLFTTNLGFLFTFFVLSPKNTRKPTGYAGCRYDCWLRELSREPARTQTEQAPLKWLKVPIFFSLLFIFGTSVKYKNTLEID